MLSFPKAIVEAKALRWDFTLYRVSLLDMYQIHQKLHEFGDTDGCFDAAIDGVPINNSNGKSMTVLSIKFPSCRNVYALAILEPGRKHMKIPESVVLFHFLQELRYSNLTLRYFIADAPMRAKLMGMSGHSGNYPCAKCLARKVGPGFPASTAIGQEKRTAGSVNAALHYIERNCRGKDGKVAEPKKKKDLEVVKGIRAVSPLASVEDFDMLKQIPTESMHLVDLGVVRKMVKISFDYPAGTKRVSFNTPDLSLLDEELETVKVPTEFSRRTRGVDPTVWKAEEYRNLILAFFPIVVRHMTSVQCREIWYLTVYIVRAVNLPMDVMREAGVTDALVLKWYQKFQSVFGIHNCSYNVHCFSHILEVRKLGPLSETSAVRYEDMYGVLKRNFHAGTQSMGKQASQNSLVSLTYGHHCCQKSVTFKEKETQKNSDVILYTRQGMLVKCTSVLGSTILGLQIHVEDGLYLYEQYDFNKVLCFRVKKNVKSKEEEILTIPKSDITGKGVLAEDIISVIPNNLLV